jgi:hypothetical protein
MWILEHDYIVANVQALCTRSLSHTTPKQHCRPDSGQTFHKQRIPSPQETSSENETYMEIKMIIRLWRLIKYILNRISNLIKSSGLLQLL